MQKPGDGSRSSRESNPAGYDVVELSESIRGLVEQAVGVSWYESGNDVDAAVAALCRLRRAAAGARGSADGGDAAVRSILGEIEPGAVLWVATRAISYMDEQGFPESLDRS